MKKQLHILSLCDLSGEMVRPWVEAGHYCLCVDIQAAKSSAPGYHLQADILACLGNMWDDYYTWPDIVFAAPPCTELAVSGARWWARKGARPCFDAMHLVYRCRDICVASTVPWALENPTGRLSTIWRKPNYSFDPCDYGDPYTKRTHLWTGRGFIMPEKHRVEPTQGSKMHLMPPSTNRAYLRSLTPAGFARAVFEANEPALLKRAPRI